MASSTWETRLAGSERKVKASVRDVQSPDVGYMQSARLYFNVKGVKPTARNPSRLIRIVVGLKSCVPFERVPNGAYSAEAFVPFVRAVAEYAPYSKARKATHITRYNAANRPQIETLLCGTSAEAQPV